MTSTEYQQLVVLLRGQFTWIEGQFGQIDRRFDRLETELREFRSDVLGHFDEIYRRLDRLEQEYYAITQALRRIETPPANEPRRREVIEESLAELKRQVTAIQARIAELESRLHG